MTTDPTPDPPAVTQPPEATTGTSRRVDPSARRALAWATFGTPVVAFLAFLLVYGTAASSPDAPTGDTTFAWLPLVYLMLTGPVWLLVVIIGAVGLGKPPPNRTGVVAGFLVCAIATMEVLYTFRTLPDWGGSEGVPTGVAPMAVVAALISLALPAWLLVALVRER